MSRGHIRQRGPSTFQVIVEGNVDPRTGKRRQIVRTVHTTKPRPDSAKGWPRDVERVRTQLLAEVDDGRHASAKGSLGELLDAWAAISDRAETTRAQDRMIIEKMIRPDIGDFQLRKLRTHDLDRFYAKLGAMYARSTVTRAHGVIRRALRQGVTWGWLPVNPALGATVTGSPSVEHEPPTPAELAAVLDRAQTDDPELAVFLLVAADSGARRGELCGLRRGDVRLDEGRIRIRRSVAQPSRELLVKQPKTKASIRSVALAPATLAVLELHLKAMAARAEDHGVTLTADAYVFSNEADDGRPWAPGGVTHRFIRVRDDVGVTFRLHDLRHFVGSRLMDAGIAATTVSARLGHARTSTTTDLYGHAISESDRHAAETIGRIIDR